MSATARRTRTQLGEQVNPKRLVEAGARRIASRGQIRALLALFLSQDGRTVEQVEMSESGTPVTEADLLWWAAQTPQAAIDDDQYPGD